MWLPSGKRYATTAFVEATIGGILPFLSDAFDTMKLDLFSNEAVNLFCLQSEGHSQAGSFR